MKLDTNAIQDLLKTHKQHVTASRIAICEYVLRPESHSTIEDIKKHLEKTFPSVSLATIYNTIHMLIEIGKLKSFKDPHSKNIVYDSTVEPHYHFYDTQTKTLHDIEPHEVQITIKNPQKYNIENINLILQGQKNNNS